MRKLLARAFSWLYFRYFFDAGDVAKNFTIWFLPENMEGKNRHFFLLQTRYKALDLAWKTRVEVGPGGYRLSYTERAQSIEETQYERQRIASTPAI